MRKLFVAVMLVAAWKSDFLHAMQPDGRIRPNIILFLSDDHGMEDAGCYGNPDVRTPVIDQLAGEGMRFTRAYTPVSVCAPSRSALFTGLYPHRNGCHRNHSAVHTHIRSLPHYLSAVGYEVVLAGKVHVKPVEAFPFTYMERHEVPGFLGKAGSKPFCLIVSLNAPHAPYFNIKGGYGKVRPKPWMPATAETLRYTAAYYDHVAMADQEIGSVLYWLEKYRLTENAVCIYTSDHGATFPYSKWTLYEQGIRIPLIIKWPGVVQAGIQSDALVSMVDLLPTLLEMAHVTPPEGLDGKSMLPLFTGAAAGQHRAVFACYSNLGAAGANEYPIRAVISDQYKLIVNLRHQQAFTVGGMHQPDKRAVIDPLTVLASWRTNSDPAVRRREYDYRHRPYLELYDLKKDPYEQSNLALDGKSGSVLQELYHQLSVWMKNQNDPLWPELSPDLLTENVIR